MQYDVETPVEYISCLDKDWRREMLESLRALIKSLAPEVTEGINYKMLRYRDSKGVIFHLNAQKNCVSLYVGDANKIDPDGSLLKGLERGKGCIRFKKSVVIADTRIDEFIERAFKLRRRGADIAC